jgi:hypothetical protein
MELRFEAEIVIILLQPTAVTRVKETPFRSISAMNIIVLVSDLFFFADLQIVVTNRGYKPWL